MLNSAPWTGAIDRATADTGHLTSPVRAGGAEGHEYASLRLRHDDIADNSSRRRRELRST